MKIFRTVENLSKSIGDFIPEFALNLAARLSVFMIFWLSAQTKLGGESLWGQKWMFWNVAENTFMLFEYEYALPLIPANIAAYMATLAEFWLAIFVLLGLFTRTSALMLIIITLVIQIFVYPGSWAQHLLWLVPLVYLLKEGGGQLSLDRKIT
ncbi:putative oxidoreductase [Alteromonadaceae bacterium Bs31]|nr:putative oxidoreductase [Alteromonadaceae bacterium Bs31]